MLDGSILNDTKKMLGIDESYSAFDLDITLHINSVFSNLAQLGVGPEEGFEIEDSGTMWSEFLGEDRRISNVKSYMFLRVRMMFDPPQVSVHVTAMKEQIAEQEWRLNSIFECDKIDAAQTQVVIL